MADSHSSEGVRTKEAEAFEARLMAAVPALKAYARRLSDDRGSSSAQTIVEVPCPNPKISGDMVCWMEAGTDPSLAFGAWWHSHASLFDGSVEAGWDGIIDFAVAILADELVLVREVDGRRNWTRVLDLREEDALAELLTSKYCSDVVDVLTWSGSGDRRVALADL